MTQELTPNTQITQENVGLTANGDCKKCGYPSGDDWSQCGASCPIPCSPHFRAAQPSAGALGEAVDPEYRKLLTSECETRIRNGETMGAVAMMTVSAKTLLGLLNATPAQPDTGDVAALREACQPFIDAMKVIRPDDADATLICLATVGDYRRLAAAYAALSKPNAPGREG